MEYKICTVFERGFTCLCDIPFTKIKRSHHVLIGMDVYVAYVHVRGHLDKYAQTVAVEFPPIVHADSCCDHKGCSQDWAAVWWNGMGHLLLDGRNPQTFDKAVEYFKHLQFGQVGEDCKWHMFLNILQLNKPAICSFQFINCIKDHLVQKLMP
ncbi:hypothetical protein BKA83DRAFT_4057790 [Pisolithus microcarpus]|nr:hypothetical protein BKA83DRAFT_4057790 [Pisolithus microcarpus]